jgi:hypothetical protein
VLKANAQKTSVIRTKQFKGGSMDNPKLFETRTAIRLADGEQEPYLSTDITLRDLFAGFVYAGSISNPTHEETDIESHSKWAYQVADAMLKARKVSPSL